LEPLRRAARRRAEDRARRGRLPGRHRLELLRHRLPALVGVRVAVRGAPRSGAFEAQFRTHLRERFGSDWFMKREAGSLVRELWQTGMSMTADEMLNEVTGQEIEMDAVAQRTPSASA